MSAAFWNGILRAHARTAMTTTPEPTDPAGVSEMAGDVERAAKALCEVAHENARRDTGDETLVASYGWQDWIPDAKAAIAALSRTPDPVLEVAKEALERAIETLAASRHLLAKYCQEHHWLPEHDRRIEALKAALQTINKRSNHEG